jgi:hypothetical protein
MIGLKEFSSKITKKREIYKALSLKNSIRDVKINCKNKKINTSSQ